MDHSTDDSEATFGLHLPDANRTLEVFVAPDAVTAAMDGVEAVFHEGARGSVARSVADPLTTWTKRANPFTTNAFYDVTYAAGKFVVVGDNGAIAVSPDGSGWSRATTPTSNRLARACSNTGSTSGRDIASTSDRMGIGW